MNYPRVVFCGKGDVDLEHLYDEIVEVTSMNPLNARMIQFEDIWMIVVICACSQDYITQATHMIWAGRLCLRLAPHSVQIFDGDTVPPPPPELRPYTRVPLPKDEPVQVFVPEAIIDRCVSVLEGSRDGDAVIVQGELDRSLAVRTWRDIHLALGDYDIALRQGDRQINVTRHGYVQE